MSEKVKAFVDHASQPSRALIVFLRATNIPHEIVQIRIGKAEHRSAEYVKINLARKVPAIVDNGFTLTESHTILRYLARKFKVADHWYPLNDLQKLARVDEYLDFHHTGTRKCSNYVFYTAFAPVMGIPAPPGFDRDFAKKEVQSNLKFFAKKFLKDTPYICNP